MSQAAVITPKFITSGNVMFTATVPKKWAEAHHCEPSYVFRVSKKEDSRVTDTNVFFVSMLVGRRFSYLGLLDAATGVVRTTTKSQFVADGGPLSLLNRCLLSVWKGSNAIESFMGFSVRPFKQMFM